MTDFALYRAKGRHKGNQPPPPQFEPGQVVAGVEIIELLGRKAQGDQGKTVWHYLCRCTGCGDERDITQYAIAKRHKDGSRIKCECQTARPVAIHREVEMEHQWGYAPDKGPVHILWERWF